MKTKLLCITAFLLAMDGSLFAQVNVQTLSASGAVSLQAKNNLNTLFNITLTGNVTQTSIDTGFKGQQANFNICQNSVGGFTWTWPTTFQGTSSITIATGASVCTQAQFVNVDGTTWQNTGGSVGGASSPVINVTNAAYGASPTLTDNSTAFSALASAVNSQSYNSLGTASIRNIYQTPSCGGGCASATIAVTWTAGDTGCIFIGGPQPPNVTTVTDASGNFYGPVTPLTQNSNNVASSQWFCTSPGSLKAYTGNVTITAAGGNFIGGFAIDLQNVGAIGQIPAAATGSSTSPSVTAAIADNNGLLLNGISFWANAATTIAANAGTLQASFNELAGSSSGAGIVSQTSASANTSLTMSATLSNSSGWASQVIEVRPVQVIVPTVYFPCPVSAASSNCTYTYSGGLNFTKWVWLTGDPGATLCPQGTGNAVDLGSTLTGTSGPNAFSYQKVGVGRLKFTCGGNATSGIVFHAFNINAEVSNVEFLNFGNSKATFYQIDGSANGQERFLIANNWFEDTDNVPRKSIATGTSTTEPQIINNYIACSNGFAGTGLCDASKTAAWATIGGLQAIIEGNNGTARCPFVLITSGALNVQIIDNSFETTPTGAANACPPIQFSGNSFGLRVVVNAFTLHNLNPALGPVNGSATLANSQVSYNSIVELTGPVVVENNVTGQTGNLSFGNICSSTAGSTGDSVPCPQLHTTGANIGQWNSDYSPALTFAAGTTASYTFQTTYAVAPPCTVPPNIPGTATTLTITTLSTTTLTVTASAANSATIHAFCNVDAQ